MRAHAYVSGLKLPPRGSAQDAILSEIIQRDRAERIATITLFANIVGGGLGVKPEVINTMLKTYKDIVSEYAYTPEYANEVKKRRRQEVAKKVQKQASDDDLLKKVQQYSAQNKKE